MKKLLMLMNQILKERNATIKNNLVDINHNQEIEKTKMLAQEKYIKDLNFYSFL